jgi:hypothetical protein
MNKFLFFILGKKVIMKKKKVFFRITKPRYVYLINFLIKFFFGLA